MTYRVGDVVYVPFPYANDQVYETRPAYVNAMLKNGFVILSYISSRNNSHGNPISIRRDNFTSGRLRNDSFVYPERIFTCKVFTIEEKAGELSNNIKNLVQGRLERIFCPRNN